jgi:hypothetical protein
MRKLGALTIMAAALGGCSSFSYLGETYGAMQAQIVTTKADTWRVFDRTAESKILVQRNPDNAAAQGVVGSLGLKAANAAMPQPEYQEAAEAFLAQSGRTCRIKDGYLVVAPSWEFSYECDPGQRVSGSPPKR